MHGESYEDFVIRAHSELQQYIADPMQRNQVVWSAWESIHGDTERDRAEQYFGDDQYVHRYNVPLWQEHEAVIPGPDGAPIVKKNDVNRLKQIVQENNLRIADTDAYTALVDKHTIPPGAADKHIERPKTIGFVGPYRLGMVGRVQPKFAVFADEHHRKDAAQVLRDRPRRSVEVLTLAANGRPYFDPIACLSEAPRLPLPVAVYSANTTDGDAIIERYEGVAAAAPAPSFAGGSNTYIPGAVRRKDKFDALSGDDDANPSPDSSQRSGLMALEPQDLKTIVDAIMSTPQMQFLSQMMQEGGTSPGQPDQMPGANPGSTPPGPGPAAGPPQNNAPPTPGGAPAQREPYMPIGQMPNPSMGMGSVANRFSAEESFDGMETEMQTVSVEQYQALAQEQANLMHQLADVRKSNAILHARAADADRKVAINELYQAYPHFIDVQAELDRCLYSAGSDMDDDVFARHIQMLEQYAAKAPAMTRMVPDGEAPMQYAALSVETERYGAQITARSAEIYSAELAKGVVLTADECWARAEAEIKGRA